MKKSICFITDSVFSLGGIQRVVTDLANNLCESYNVDIICLNRVKPNNRINYGLNNKVKTIGLFNSFAEDFIMIPIRSFNIILEKNKIFKNNKRILFLTTSIRFYFRNKRLPKLINKKKYDYVVATGLNNCIMLAKQKRKIDKNIILVGWWHSSYKNYVESGNYPKKQIISSLNKLDKTLVLTKSDQKLIKENLGIDVFQIYNPIPEFENINSEDKIKYKRIIAVGRYHQIKQFDKAIKAFDFFINLLGNEQWTFDIIGEGEERESLNNVIEKNNLSNCVRLYGKTNNIFDEYNKSSLMIITSFSEGLPTVVLEAMKFGIPVVGFSIPVLQEILPLSDVTLVKQDDTEELAKRIVEIVRDEQLRKKIRSEYQNELKKFRIKEIINEWENKIIK